MRLIFLFCLIFLAGICKAQLKPNLSYTFGTFYGKRTSELIGVDRLEKTKTIVVFHDDVESDYKKEIEKYIEANWKYSEFIILDFETFKSDYKEKYKQAKGESTYSYLMVDQSVEFDASAQIVGYGETNSSTTVVFLSLLDKISKPLSIYGGSTEYAISHINYGHYPVELGTQLLFGRLDQQLSDRSTWNHPLLTQEALDEMKAKKLHIFIDEESDDAIEDQRAKLKHILDSYPGEIEIVQNERIHEAIKGKEDFLYLDYAYITDDTFKKMKTKNILFYAVMNANDIKPIYRKVIFTGLGRGMKGIDFAFHVKGSTLTEIKKLEE